MVNLLTATLGGCCLLMRLLHCLRRHCRSESCWKHRLLENLCIVEPSSFASTTCWHIPDVWHTKYIHLWARRTPLHLHWGRGFAAGAAVLPPQAEISAAMWEQLQQMQERHELLHRQLTGKCRPAWAMASYHLLHFGPSCGGSRCQKHCAATSMLASSCTHLQEWRQLSWTTRRQPG